MLIPSFPRAIRSVMEYALLIPPPSALVPPLNWPFLLLLFVAHLPCVTSRFIGSASAFHLNIHNGAAGWLLQ